MNYPSDKKDKKINREIANYCISKFPDSCLAYNDSNIHFDEEALVEELDELFSIEIMGLCGCGAPELCQRDIRNILRVFNGEWDDRRKNLQKYFNVQSIYENSLLLFLVYMLNDKDMLEHGTSVGGSWITDLGQMYLTVLEQMDLDSK